MSYGIVILRGARRDEQLILIKEYGEPVAFATLLEANTAAARLCGGIDVDAVPAPLPDETLSQLLESANGNHLWAERYDRQMEDIFAVQDELVRAISGVIPGQLDRYAVEILRRKPPKNLRAYDAELRDRWALTPLE